MKQLRLDPLVLTVLLAEFVIVSTSIGIVCYYDTWLGALGFVLGFTVLICVVPILAGLDRPKSESELQDKAAA